jgi:hypothetical protein
MLHLEDDPEFTGRPGSLSSKARRGGAWVPSWISGVLAVSAFLFLGFRMMLALGREDTDPLESPLMLSVARQLVAGPWELYGPFGGQNPLVLIHAPLYYHLAALAAWPLTRAGLDPVTAARLAGRALSVLGLLVTLRAAYHLARLDGAPRRAGWWAALLIAAMPVLAGQPFAVRPDMIGVALQTTGVLMVLETLRLKRVRGVSLLGAYAAFGLAVCVKQHFLAAPAVSTGLLLWSWWRGRVAWPAIERSLLVAGAIVAALYGLEGMATGGRMWQAVVVAAGSVGRIHPAGWLHVGTVVTAVIGKCAGLIALLAAAGLAAMATRPDPAPWAFREGLLLVGLITALAILQLAIVRPWVTGPLVVVLLATLALVIPGSALLARRSMSEGRLDATLWAFCAGELFLLVVLSRVTTGAWINYAIQAVVIAAVLSARALARALEGAPQLRPALPAVLAVLAVLATALIDIKELASLRRAERAALERVFAHSGRPPSMFFFADRPGLNRVYGRLDLVYDDWLYQVFESLNLAEPRARWLRLALTSGPVRVVVLESDRPRIDGVPEPLSALGYLNAVRVGPFWVWISRQ